MGDALLCMGDHRLPKRVISGELDDAGQHGLRRKKGWADCAAEDCRVVSITGDWSTAALDLGALVQHSMRRELSIYGRVGEGRGKGVQTLAKKERGGRGRQG